MSVGDGTFNIYRLNGKSELGQPYEYDITFISPHRLEEEEFLCVFNVEYLLP